VIIYDEQIRHGLTAGVGLGALLLVLGSRSSNCPAPGLPPPSTPPHHDRPVPSPLMIGPSLTVPGSDGADGSSGAPERRYLQWLFILGHRGRSDSPLPPESSAPSDAPSLPAPPVPAAGPNPHLMYTVSSLHSDADGERGGAESVNRGGVRGRWNCSSRCWGDGRTRRALRFVQRIYRWSRSGWCSEQSTGLV